MEVHTARPLPAAVAFRLHCYLFAQGLALLFLLQRVKVETGEVLVHEHVVLQELEARRTGHHDLSEVMLGVEAKGEEVAQIA